MLPQHACVHGPCNAFALLTRAHASAWMHRRAPCLMKRMRKAWVPHMHAWQRAAPRWVGTLWYRLLLGAYSVRARQRAACCRPWAAGQRHHHIKLFSSRRGWRRYSILTCTDGLAASHASASARQASTPPAWPARPPPMTCTRQSPTAPPRPAPAARPSSCCLRAQTMTRGHGHGRTHCDGQSS